MRASLDREPLMELLNLYGTKGKRRARKAKAKAKAAPHKTLGKMTREQIEALPEREFVRLLTPSGRGLYRDMKKLRGAF